jgi:hypothetical protein
MAQLGLIDPHRLALLPTKYWSHHEFCFYLHDQMTHLLVQYEASGVHNLVLDSFKKVRAEHQNLDSDVDILSLLREKDLDPLYRHHVVSHLVLGLTSDMLHFLYEALTCLEKRKFAVAFALLRKPLKENLIFLSWLLGSESDFLTRFEKDNYTTLNGLDSGRRQQILSAAIAKLPTSEAFSSDLLEGIIFSKTHAMSFEPIWQRATHLITSQGAALRTEDLNINFIFHDASSDDLYEVLYCNLPYVLLYAIQVALECFSRIAPSNQLSTSHLLIVSMGAYECLFDRRRRSGVTAMLTRNLKSFLKCSHCQAPVRLTRNNAVSMYLREHLSCQRCGLEMPFPLYWLFGQCNIKVERTSSSGSIFSDAGVGTSGGANGA